MTLSFKIILIQCSWTSSKSRKLGKFLASAFTFSILKLLYLGWHYCVPSETEIGPAELWITAASPSLAGLYSLHPSFQHVVWQKWLTDPFVIPKSPSTPLTAKGWQSVAAVKWRPRMTTQIAFSFDLCLSGGTELQVGTSRGLFSINKYFATSCTNLVLIWHFIILWFWG